MNIHKRTRLTLLDRQEIWRLYRTRVWKVTHLAERLRVSRPTIYDVLKGARLQEFVPRNSTDQRFKTPQFGLKRLAKIGQTIQERLKRAAKRYSKSYPGELVHFDTKRLPLLKGQFANEPRDYLFVAIDDFSRECIPISFPIKLSTAPFAFLQALLLNILIRSTMLIPITAKNLKEMTIMLSIKLANNTVSVRSLLVSIVPKPTARPRESSAL